MSEEKTTLRNFSVMNEVTPQTVTGKTDLFNREIDKLIKAKLQLGWSKRRVSRYLETNFQLKIKL